jgi:hypothetical protein
LLALRISSDVMIFVRSNDVMVLIPVERWTNFGPQPRSGAR